MHNVCQNIMDYAIYHHAKSLDGSLNKRIKDSANYFGVTLGNITRTAQNGESLDYKTPERPVMTGISKHLTFEFYDSPKTDNEISVLLSFLAMKSILGKKSFCRITTAFLLCRMAGYSTISEMSELPEQLKKYRSRWHLDCLKSALRNHYGLKIYGRYTRGFYISFELPEEQLIEEVEKKRKKYIEKTYKEQSGEALKRVLARLYPELSQY